MKNLSLITTCLFMSAVSLTALGQIEETQTNKAANLSIISQLDKVNHNRDRSLSNYSIIVKWKDLTHYNNLLQTPESKTIENNKKISDKAKYQKKQKLNLVSTGNREAGLTLLTKIRMQTGLKLKHIRSSSTGVDLFKVQTKKEYKEVHDILMTTGLFKYINENKVMRINSVDMVKPIPVRNRTSTQSGLATSQSFNTTKYNDTYFLDSLYLDEQQKHLMGAHSVLKANDYVDANKSISRKVRIAILDTGKWEHEDVVWSDDGIDMISGDYFSDCLSNDTTNSGLDVSCPLADYKTKERDTDPTDKSWRFDRDGSNNPSSDGDVKIKGHGLSVASTVAAVRNNGVGVIGSLDSNDVELIAVRVMDYQGGTFLDIADGVMWAAGADIPGVPSISEPVDVINLSLAATSVGCPDNGLMQDAINYAREQNVVVIAGAGNDYVDVKNVEPASCKGVLTVGGNDHRGEITSFSNHGELIDVTFSGYANTAWINSTSYKDTETSLCQNYYTGAYGERDGCYAQSGGTSFSAPLASALAASIIMVNPNLSEGEIRKIIETTASEYDIDEYGNTTLRATKIANANIGNYYNAVKSNFNVTELDKGTVLHRYASYTTPAKEIYLQEMEKLAGKDKVCNTYNLSWGLFGTPVNTIDYELYVSNSSDEAMNSANSELVVDPFNTTRVSPSSIVDMTGFTRVGVKSCKDGSCGDVYELDLTQAQLPNYCVN